MDEKLSVQNQKIEGRFAAQNLALGKLFSGIERRIDKLEERFLSRLDHFTTTLDKFLKRFTDIEEEFVFMKDDPKRVKAVLREKLAVSLD